MQPSSHGLALRLYPEEGQLFRTEPGRLPARLGDERDAQRSERLLVERLAGSIVADGESCVVKHVFLRSARGVPHLVNRGIAAASRLAVWTVAVAEVLARVACEPASCASGTARRGVVRCGWSGPVRPPWRPSGGRGA